MTIYFGLLLIILFLCLFIGKNNLHNNVILIIIVSLIFIFMGFRENFTPDYSNYEDVFNKISHGSGDEMIRMELGFIWLNSLLTSYRDVIIVISMFFCFSLFFSFKKFILPKFWWLGFLILFLNINFLLGNISGMRSCIVTSAYIFAINFQILKKPLLYIFTLLGLSLFHTSALMLMPFVIITNKNMSSNNKFIIFLIIFVFATISTFFPDVINSYTLDFIKNYFDKYEVYMQEGINVKITFFSLTRIILILFLLYQTINNIHNNLSDSSKIMMKYSILYFILLLAPGIGLISRFYYYLTFPFIIGTIYSFSAIRKNVIKYSFISGVFLIILYDLYNFTNNPIYSLYYLLYNSTLFK